MMVHGRGSLYHGLLETLHCILEFAFYSSLQCHVSAHRRFFSTTLKSVNTTAKNGKAYSCLLNIILAIPATSPALVAIVVDHLILNLPSNALRALLFQAHAAPGQS